jgi:hypothetical protein
MLYREYVLVTGKGGEGGPSLLGCWLSGNAGQRPSLPSGMHILPVCYLQRLLAGGRLAFSKNPDPAVLGIRDILVQS